MLFRSHNIQCYRRRRGSHARYTGEAVVSFVIVRVAIAEKQMQMTAGAAVDDHHPDPPRQPLNGGGLTMLQVAWHRASGGGWSRFSVSGGGQLGLWGAAANLNTSNKHRSDWQPVESNKARFDQPGRQASRSLSSGHEVALTLADVEYLA